MAKRRHNGEANGAANGSKKSKTGESSAVPGEGSPSKKQLHLTAFMRPVSLHTGAWRYPGAYPFVNSKVQVI